MFFNKLKEELKDYLKEMLAIFATKYDEGVLNAIKIYNLPIDTLKAKYKHTRWSEISPLEKAAFEEKFNLSLIFGFKCSKLLPYLSTDYISDTLEELQAIENSKAVEPENKEFNK